MEGLIIPNPKLCETSINLHNRLVKSKELTLEQFLQEVGYWAIKDGFDELTPKQIPRKPQEVIEYEQIPIERRLQLKQEYFKERPGIKEWYRIANWVERQNADCLHWLKEILSYIPKEDVITRKKVENQIIEFQTREDGLSREAEAAKEVFNAERLR